MANSRIYCKTPNCQKWSKLNAEQYCPKCATTEEEIDVDCKCNICNKDVHENDKKNIGCDLCNNWYHSECVGCPNGDLLFNAVLAFFLSIHRDENTLCLK